MISIREKKALPARFSLLSTIST